NVALGVVGGYIGTGLAFNNGNRIEYSGFQGAVYGGWESNNAYVQAVAGYGHYNNSSTRNVTIGLVTGTTNGEYDTNVASFYGETGYHIRRGAMVVTPYAALGAASVWSDAFTETGFP